MRLPILRLKDILRTSIQVDLTDQDALDFQGDVRRTEGIEAAMTQLDAKCTVEQSNLSVPFDAAHRSRASLPFSVAL